jgi:hypothetical protein
MGSLRVRARLVSSSPTLPCFTPLPRPSPGGISIDGVRFRRVAEKKHSYLCRLVRSGGGVGGGARHTFDSLRQRTHGGSCGASTEPRSQRTFRWRHGIHLRGIVQRGISGIAIGKKLTPGRSVCVRVAAEAGESVIALAAVQLERWMMRDMAACTLGKGSVGCLRLRRGCRLGRRWRNGERHGVSFGTLSSAL